MLSWCVAAAIVQAPKIEEPAPIERFKAAAAQYDIRIDDAAKSKLTLFPKPLLHWDNPARTAEDGAVFVWTGPGATVEFTGTARDLQSDVARVEWSSDGVTFHRAETSDGWANWRVDVPLAIGCKYHWKPWLVVRGELTDTIVFGNENVDMLSNLSLSVGAEVHWHSFKTRPVKYGY